MAHKFKIGQMVQYRPGGRSLREASGAYSITGFLPENAGQPAYRIRHFSEEHERVAHESELSAAYVRNAENIKAAFYHINTAECFFSLCKRAVFGAHHSISEAHLFRYLAEWDFKFNSRKVSDGERTALIAQQVEGKRLMYQRPSKTA
jgi:hypothetical protein